MKLKLIQVGLGGHGRFVGSSFVMKSPDFEYVGLVDKMPEALETFAEEHQLSERLFYTDYRQAFRELDADAVLIEAASPAHYAICKEALLNGLHVLVEKPFTLTLQEAAELVQLADEMDRNIMVNQNYRYYPTVLTLKHAMKHCKLGQLLFMNAQFFYDHQGKPYQREMDNYILLEMSVHHVDMIRFLLDSNITSVRGRTWNYAGSGYTGAPTVNAEYLSELGVPTFYTSSLVAKGLSMPWEGIWRIQYEKGSLHLDDLGDGYGVYKVDEKQVKTKLPTKTPTREGIHGVLEEFARSIVEKREPATSGRDNLHTLAALFATSEASERGNAIQVLTEEMVK